MRRKFIDEKLSEIFEEKCPIDFRCMRTLSHLRVQARHLFVTSQCLLCRSAWPQPLPPLRSVQGLRLMLFRQESRANRTLVMQSLPQDVAFLDCRPPLQSICTQHILGVCERNFFRRYNRK